MHMVPSGPLGVRMYTRALLLYTSLHKGVTLDKVNSFYLKRGGARRYMNREREGEDVSGLLGETGQGGRVFTAALERGVD